MKTVDLIQLLAANEEALDNDPDAVKAVWRAVMMAQRVDEAMKATFSAHGRYLNGFERSKILDYPLETDLHNGAAQLLSPAKTFPD